MGKAAVFHGVGRPFEWVRYAEPRPQGGEILVRVVCCTLCRSDLHTHAGRRTEPTPLVLGHEIIGRIEAFGPSAARHDARGAPASVGDRITWSVTVGCGDCFFCAEALPQKCQHLFKYGHQRATADRLLSGGLAEHVVLVPGTCWLRVPDGLPDHVAAPANCATATAAAMLRNSDAWPASRSPRSAPLVVVLGAGMLGLTACALARSAGAGAVIAVDLVSEAVQRAKLFGASHGVLSESAVECVAEVTEGRGADVVLELAGTALSVEMGLKLMRVGGVLVLGGTVLPTATVAFDPESIVRRLLTIRGVHNYAPCDLETAIDFLDGPGREYPFASLIGEVFALAEIEQAFGQGHAHPGVRMAVVP